MVTAEWRSCLGKKSEVEDERTKEKSWRKTIVHQIEFLDPKTKADMPFEFTQIMPEDFDTDKFNAGAKPFAKGERVAIEIVSFGWSDFRKRYLGKGTPHRIDK